MVKIMNIKGFISAIVSAVEISVFYVSTIFIADIVSDKYGFAAAVVYMVFAAVLYGIALISRNKKEWLLKFGASIPFSLLCLLYFRLTDYSIRALNWVFPDYGLPSAGGQFASSFLFVIFSVMCLICLMISLFIRIKDYEKFSKIQLVITSVFAVLIICAVLILERQFPSYEYIAVHAGLIG